MIKILLITLLMISSVFAKSTYVHSYKKKNGTVVSAHYRTSHSHHKKH
jgi:hypothetical protein